MCVLSRAMISGEVREGGREAYHPSRGGLMHNTPSLYFLLPHGVTSPANSFLKYKRTARNHQRWLNTDPIV